MIKQFRVFLVFLKADLQSYMEYRLGSLIWIINGAIGPLLVMWVWLVISSQKTLSLSPSQITTYFFLSILVTRLTQVWTIDQVGDQIKNGEISQVLLKPYSYVIQNLSEQIGQKASRLSALIPVLIVLGVILKSNLNFNFEFWRICLFILAVVLGFSVVFLMEHTLALLAFWVEDIHGFSRIYSTVGGLFSGNVIPLALMPGLLQHTMRFYPARFTSSFPLEILVTQSNPSEILLGFAICLAWIVLFLFFRRMLFIKSIRKYSAVGG